MRDQVLGLFGIYPDDDLDIRAPGQNLFDVTCNVLTGPMPFLEKEGSDIVLVHGDTTPPGGVSGRLLLSDPGGRCGSRDCGTAYLQSAGFE